MINRRDFLSGLVAGSALASTGAIAATSATQSGTDSRFRLNYAPHFGMFRHSGGDDLLDQLRFAADEGFVAFEDNGLRSRSVSFQDRMRREMDRRGMQMGLFVGTADFGKPTFASGQTDLRDQVLADMRLAAETASRMNARWCSVLPGKPDPRLSRQRQTASAVDLLKRCTDICERAGLVILLEPLDHAGRSPRLFLQSVPQAFAICRAVDSPYCKMLYDVYQQHTTDYDVCEQIQRFSSEIAYLQIADNPGRKEPGTGDIDYRAIFRLLQAEGYRGIVGMEHGNSLPGRRGERAVIDAYVRHDCSVA